MLELICHQRYRANGVPVDVTPYRNHGSAFDTAAASGRLAGTTAIAFPRSDSAVQIGLGATGAWAPLGALKIEVVAYCDPHAQRVIGLVEGDGAFVFDIMEHCIEAGVPGPDNPCYLRSDEEHSPDGQFHEVPRNRWVTLGFYHDGFAKAQLTIDDAIVAEVAVARGVPGVQGEGVAIGNRLGRGQPMPGTIDEVRIWRSDPNAMRREFLCRPYNAKTAQCWEALFIAVRKAWAVHPDAMQTLLDFAQSYIDAFIRALLLLPAAEQAKVRALLDGCIAHWCKGSIDSVHMRDALHKWRHALKAAGVPAPSPDLVARVEFLWPQLGLETQSLDCDPKALGFFKLLHETAA